MQSYEKAGRLIIFINWIVAIILVFSFIAFVLPDLIPRLSIETIDLFIPFFLLMLLSIILLVVQFKIGTAIIEHKKWGRVGGIIWGVIQLFTFPIGTICGVYVLWSLIKGWDDFTKNDPATIQK
ncbi:MAG: hypothetical protein GY865_13750 [candidate division Zixibacteria bacterium]|nr:hypothetical protein [candidate division Zixibacteria bacterium]